MSSFITMAWHSLLSINNCYLINRAMYNLILGLIKEGVIKNPFTEKIQEEAAYKKRFEIFQHIIYPPYMPYEKYSEVIAPLLAKKVHEILYKKNRKRSFTSRQKKHL